MSRPLVVTDCDEVLLSTVVPFRTWLDENHAIHFDFTRGFVEGLRHKHDGSALDLPAIWPLLESFFDSEMHRQTPFADAVEAIATLQAHADVVVLTNLLDHRREPRRAQLAALGIDAPVVTNQGGKGAPLAALMAERQPSVTLFVDDLAPHHQSAAEHAPEAWRLHMIAEPELAPHHVPAPHAHARIDSWAEALPWIMDRLTSC